MPIINNLVSKLSLKDGASKPLSGYNKKLQRTKQRQKKVKSQALSMGKAIAGAFTAGVAIKGISAMISATSELEDGMAKVFGLLDKTKVPQETFNQLQKENLEIQKKFGFTQEETNQAMFDSISAGVDAGKAMLFLDSASKLAIGGSTGLDTAVDGLTSVMNAYGKSAEDATGIANTFFLSQVGGKTDVKEIANNIGNVAPIAKAFGATFEEVGASMASLTAGGISIEESGTGMKAIFSSLIKQTPASAKAFAKMGIKIKKSDGTFRKLGDILGEVSEKTKGNASALAELFPNIRAFNAVNSLTRKGMEKYHEALALTQGESTQLAQAYERNSETLSQQTKVLKANFRVLVVTLGVKLMPVFKGVVKGLLAMTEALSRPEIYIPTLIIILSILATVLWTTVIPALVTMAISVWATLSPVLLVILAIAGLALLIAIFWEEIVKAVKWIWEMIKAFGKWLMGFEAIQLAVAGLKKVFAGLQKAFGWVKGLFTGKKTEIKVTQKNEDEKKVVTERVTNVNDAIITKRGQIIRTDPEDNIIATKSDVTGTGNEGGRNIRITNLIGSLSITANGINEMKDNLESAVFDALEELSYSLKADTGLI